MREAIGGTWLVQIVVAFVLLFTGYMCISINHSKAFNVKNQIINEIESEGGLTSDAISNIAAYLNSASYRTTHDCPSDVVNKNGETVVKYYGYDRNGNKKSNNKDAAFCIAQVNTQSSSDSPNMSYYRIAVFYQLDLPIFNDLFSFTVKGDTKLMTTK
jgi:hypothetical protein